MAERFLKFCVHTLMELWFGERYQDTKIILEFGGFLETFTVANRQRKVSWLEDILHRTDSSRSIQP